MQLASGAAFNLLPLPPRQFAVQPRTLQDDSSPSLSYSLIPGQPTGHRMRAAIDSRGSRLMKVLLTEDNRAFESMLRKMLEEWGYQVVTAADAAQAYEILQAEDGPRLA